MSRWAVFAFPVALALGTACGGAGTPVAAPSPELAARDLAPGPGVGPLAACTPTGPESCFDATDDNCNGVIDEGCGVRTGLLQFVVAWEGNADVDLVVTDPSGRVVKSGEGGDLGLHKDRECGHEEAACHGQNVENVYLEGDAPAPGKYRIVVKLVADHRARLPVRVRLGVRVGSRTWTVEIPLDEVGAEREVTVAL